MEDNEVKTETQIETQTNTQTEKKSSGLATAGMVLGIVAICISFISFFDFITEVCALLAFIFSTISLIKKSSKGQALAGLILSILSVVVIANRYIAFRKTINTITSGVNDITTSFADGLDKITNSLTDGTEKISGSLSEGAEKLTDSLTDSAGKITGTLSEGAEIISNVFALSELSPDKMTLDKFNQIEVGMTYEQVVEIVGFEGKLSTESNIGDYSIKTYIWEASNGIANALVSFTNGKVSSKNQIGL